MVSTLFSTHSTNSAIVLTITLWVSRRTQEIPESAFKEENPVEWAEKGAAGPGFEPGLNDSESVVLSFSVFATSTVPARLRIEHSSFSSAQRPTPLSGRKVYVVNSAA